MVKRGTARPAHSPPERFEDSALLRSAETLGRMIGALQRQLDGATKRFARSTPEKEPSTAPLHRQNGHGPVVVPVRKPATARRASAAGAATRRPSTSSKTTRAARSKAVASRPSKATARKASAKK